MCETRVWRAAYIHVYTLSRKQQTHIPEAATTTPSTARTFVVVAILAWRSLESESSWDTPGFHGARQPTRMEHTTPSNLQESPRIPRPPLLSGVPPCTMNTPSRAVIVAICILSSASISSSFVHAQAAPGYRTQAASLNRRRQDTAHDHSTLTSGSCCQGRAITAPPRAATGEETEGGVLLTFKPSEIEVSSTLLAPTW